MSKGDLLILVCAVLWAGQILVIDHVAAKGDPVKHATYLHPTCGHSHDCFDPTVVDPFLASIATL